MKKDTIIRTVLLVVALVNLILNAAGKNTLPFTNDEISEAIATIFTVITALGAWWKNNSFTKNAIKADEYLDKLRNIPEQKGAGTLTLAEFVSKYLGKKTDWDGVYGVQCVDLIDAYIEKVLGLKIGFFGNAKTWWLDRNTSKWLKDNFDFITPKYKDGELKPGDIGIRTSGTYGHIFIVAEKNKGGTFRYYDQNADGKGAEMTLRTKAYNSDFINGILRPKAQDNICPVTKSNNPNVKAGQKVVFLDNRKCYKGAGTATGAVKISDVSAYVCDSEVVRKKGSTATVKKVVVNKLGNTWICFTLNGNEVYTCAYNAKTDTCHIKAV